MSKKTISTLRAKFQGSYHLPLMLARRALETSRALARRKAA
jgi:hypothetical protein